MKCDGDAQGGTWCNESEDNCKDCDGHWCTDDSDSAFDNAEYETEYENDGDYYEYMSGLEDLSSSNMTGEAEDLDSKQEEYEGNYYEEFMVAFDSPVAIGDEEIDEEPIDEELPIMDEDPVIDEGENENEEGQHRYIVKFKDTPDNLARARRMESRALEEQLINILPDDNAEVLKLSTEDEVHSWEEREDVEYVEKGKSYRIFFC